VAVWLSLRVLSLLTHALDVHLIGLTRIFVVVVLYGAGTDYCLFLVSRYREELQRGRLSADAIVASIKRVGGALLASAATIVVGLGLMGFSEFAKLRQVGPAVALCLSIAFVASLTLAPALLVLLGRWAFWPGSPVPLRLAVVSGSNASKPSRLWQRFSDWVTLRPLRVWAVTVLFLVPFAWLGLNTEGVFAITSELPRQAQSRRGLETIKDHFPAGELGPLTVLVESCAA
jgi:RND superfamily putative drug exporter